MLIQNLSAMRAPDDPKEADRWYQMLKDGIDKWNSTTDKNQKIQNLGDYVSKLGRALPNQIDLRWSETFFKAQSALITIPGHAQYFADEIEKLRESKTTTPGHFIYEDKRLYYLRDTLGHLPSPETVKVLGHYLNDDRDPPVESAGTMDASVFPANSFLALEAMGTLGLKHPPPSAKLGYRNQAVLDACRQWWAEVQSGKRTFSFVGQKEEYTFKSDGTWETVTTARLPGDRLRPLKRPSGTAPATILPEKSWSWITAAVLSLIGVIVWILRKSNRPIA